MLVRLQRILLLRQLGVGPSTIAEVLNGQRDTATALRTHLPHLETERERIGATVASVQRTLSKTARGEQVMPDEAFDGLDHAQFEHEVTQRWSALSDAREALFRQQQLDIAKDFGRAHAGGAPPDSDQVQAITQRDIEWLSVTPTHKTDPLAAFLSLRSAPRWGHG